MGEKPYLGYAIGTQLAYKMESEQSNFAPATTLDIDIVTRAMELFKIPNSHIQPTSKYHRNTNYKPKYTL